MSLIILSMSCRYLARTVLIPFEHDAPSVELGVLTQVIENAPACFPHLLTIGHKIEMLEVEKLKELQERVTTTVAGNIDSRLATQYAISIFCALEVSLFL